MSRSAGTDSEFDLIYVNGDNNLENLKAPDDTWKARLAEALADTPVVLVHGPRQSGKLP